MKKLFLFFCLFQTLSAFAQESTPAMALLKTPNTFGYIGGVRLDSVDAHYAQFHKRINSIIFDYGQAGNNKSKIITDAHGIPLVFAEYNFLFVVNFLYYNGWELARPCEESLYFLKKLQ